MRNAYHKFCKLQRKQNSNNEIFNISYYAFISNFAIQSTAKISANIKKRALINDNIPSFQLQNDSVRIDRSSISASVINNGFIIDDIFYKLYKVQNEPVIVYSPHFSIDYENERCCASILLMHLPWPENGESGLLNDFISNEKKYECYTEALNCNNLANMFPLYFKAHIAKQKSSSDCFNGLNENENFGDGEFNENIDIDNNSEIDSNDEFDEVDRMNNEEEAHNIPETSNTVEHLQGVQISSSGPSLKQFITNKLNEYLNKMEMDNEVLYNTTNNNHYENLDSVSKIHYENESELYQKVTDEMNKFNERQKKAVNIIESYFHKDPSIDKTNQLIMFLSGEGGTGKTTVIKLLGEKAKISYGKLGGPFDPLLCMAPTGSAANTIDGFTHQSVFYVKEPDKMTRQIKSIDASRIAGKLKGNKTNSLTKKIVYCILILLHLYDLFYSN